MVGRTPVTRWLSRLVRARYLRIIPVEFRHTFYLRVEILGCRGGGEFSETRNYVIKKKKKTLSECFTTVSSSLAVVDELVTPSSLATSPSGGGKVPVRRCKPGQFACQDTEECVSVSVLCDGRPDCKDHSDEINCGKS